MGWGGVWWGGVWGVGFAAWWGVETHLVLLCGCVVLFLSLFFPLAFFRPLNVRCTSAQATGLGLSQGLLLMYSTMGRGFVKTLFLFPQHIIARSAYRTSTNAWYFSKDRLVDLFWRVGREYGGIGGGSGGSATMKYVRVETDEEEEVGEGDQHSDDNASVVGFSGDDNDDEDVNRSNVRRRGRRERRTVVGKKRN